MSAHLKVTLKVLISLFILLSYLPVILLQIVMVSPRSHLVKNHKSLSRTNESQLKDRPQNSVLRHTEIKI